MFFGIFSVFTHPWCITYSLSIKKTGFFLESLVDVPAHFSADSFCSQNLKTLFAIFFPKFLVHPWCKMYSLTTKKQVFFLELLFDFRAYFPPISFVLVISKYSLLFFFWKFSAHPWGTKYSLISMKIDLFLNLWSILRRFLSLSKFESAFCYFFQKFSLHPWCTM